LFLAIGKKAKPFAGDYQLEIKKRGNFIPEQ
jgi:hypothetical protein